MKATDWWKMEDCFDGSAVYRCEFDGVWTRQQVLELDALGRLELYADFPRPFYRVRGKEGFQIKGVEGERAFTVILPHQGRETVLRLLADRFGNVIGEKHERSGEVMDSGEGGPLWARN